MAEKKKQGARSNRGKKSKGSIGGKLVKWGIVLGLFAASGWWLFFSDSDSKLRKSCLESLSLMVDRLDEVSHAWKQRSFPDEVEQAQKKSPREDKPAEAEREQVSPPPRSPAGKNGAVDSSTEDNAAAESAGKSTDEPEPPQKRPVGEVTEEDKKELRDLLKRLH